MKLFVSLIVGLSDSMLRLLFRRLMPGTCVIVNYHSVSKESRERFGWQMDLLLRLIKPVRATNQTIFSRGERGGAITVDDLFCSFVENGLPELISRKIPVTIFVPTGYLGRKSAWDDYGDENRVGEEVASADELKRICAFENVDFGSHCVTHPDLARLSETEVRRELRESKEALEKLTGRKIIALSFPYGSHNPRVLQLAREAGYEFFYDSTPESVPAIRAGLLGRISVFPTDSDLKFRLKILGAYRWVKFASAWKRKITKPIFAPDQAAPART
ncbi:MAG TPA: polysaccharide deacetylase family protein [Verrucomicrobiae bacterium]|nr:polysaccharide deacetylase family protein [Verrucomicrobiae bacterium]